MDRPRGFFRSVFASTAGWALLLSIPGILGTWVEKWLDGSGYGPYAYASPNAFSRWQGIPLVVLYLAFILFVVAAGNRESVRPWLPLLIAAEGLGVILLAASFIAENPRVGPIPGITIVLGVVLLFLAALGLRGLSEQDFARVGNSTFWAILLSLLGVGSLFLPWAASLQLYNAFVGWPGVVAGSLFLILFLFLLATSPLAPVPLWRSILLFVGGVLVVVIGGLFIGLCGSPAMGMGMLSPRWGSYVGLGLGVALLLVAALEIRATVFRWSRRMSVVVAGPIAESDQREKIREVDKPIGMAEQGASAPRESGSPALPG